MGNSKLVERARLSSYCTRGRGGKAIDRITVHCVVGQLQVDRILAVFQDPNKRCSANYCIDTDGSVGMAVEEIDTSWCSSSTQNDRRAVTIECASDALKPYAVNDTVWARLVELCVDVCRRNGKKKLLWLEEKAVTLAYAPAPDEMVLTVHRWFANKACPGEFLMGKMGELAATVTKALADEASEKWYEEARSWAVKTGITKTGDRPEEPATRAEVWEMLFRARASGDPSVSPSG